MSTSPDGSSGGQSAQSEGGERTEALPPDVILAEDATGVWNESQVKQYLTEELNLVEVNLQSTGGANYTGSGKGADGKSYTFTVRQVPGGIKVDFLRDGIRGSMAFGNEVPD